MRSRPHPFAEILERCTSLGALQRSIAQRLGLLDQVRRALPAPVDQHCVWAGLSEERLLLFADSPPWATRMRFLAPSLVPTLGRAGTRVTEVRVRVLAPADPPQKAPRRRPTLSSKNARLLLQVAEETDDPALREALRRLARRGG